MYTIPNYNAHPHVAVPLCQRGTLHFGNKNILFTELGVEEEINCMHVFMRIKQQRSFSELMILITVADLSWLVLLHSPC